MTTIHFRKVRLVEENELSRLVEKRIKEYNPGLNVLAKLQLQEDSILNEPDLPSEEKLNLFKRLQNRFTNIKSQTIERPVKESTDVTEILPFNRLLRGRQFSHKTKFPRNEISISEKPGRKEVSLEPVETDDSDEVEDAYQFEDAVPDLSNKSITSETLRNAEHKENMRSEESKFHSGELNRKYFPKFSNLVSLLSKYPEKLTVDSESDEAIIKGKRIARSNTSDLLNNLYRSSKSKNPIGASDFHQTLKEIFHSDPSLVPKDFISNQELLYDISTLHPLSKSLKHRYTSTSTKTQLVEGFSRQFNYPYSLPPGKLIRVLYLYPH